MAISVGIEVEGNWFGEDVIDGMQIELGDALFAGAERVANKARVLVEYSDLPITQKHPGHMRDTIVPRRARKDKWKPGAFVFAGDRAKGIFWHYFLEFGTFFEKAHPFMRPAAISSFNANKAEAARAVKRELNKKRRITDKTRRIKAGKKR